MGISRIVNTDLWVDSEIVDNYTPEDKYFWLYLLTNPQTRQVGVYKLPKKLMAFQMGYSVDSIDILLDRFENKYKTIRYSSETQEIAILNYLKYSIVKGGKPVIDCVKKDISLIKDTSLFGSVYHKIKDNTDERATILEIKEMLSIYDNDNDNDNDNDSIVPRFVPRVVIEKQIETENKQRIYKKHTKEIMDEFETFWSAYPKKVGKGAVVKIWKKLKPSKELQELILTAINNQKQSDQWTKDKGQYIPNPSTWLNQERWNDELEMCHSQGSTTSNPFLELLAEMEAQDELNGNN